MRRSIVCAVLLLGAIAACADEPTSAPGPRQATASVATATDPLSKIYPLPASLEQKVKDVRADLEANGYEVARGYWALWGVEDCKYPIQTLGYCYGNNPTAPYVVAIVPQWKDEFADQRFHHAITETQRNMITNYRLDEKEALVVLAEMPPPAKYFGILTNVFSRQAAFNPNDPIIPRVAADPLLQSILFGVSPDPSRRMLVSSIGNTTNDVVIQRKSGEVWGKQRYFVITSDADLAEAMTEALGRAGVPPSDVFTEPVSPDLVHLGLDREADDLITLIRYAMPDDDAAADQWRRQLPLTILRVRHIGGSPPNKPFAIPTYEPRTANYDETVLRDDLYALVNAVRTRWAQPAADTMSFFSAYKFLDLVGQHCLGYPNPNRGPMDCLGDNWDGDYQISRSAHLDDGEVIALVGTLGTETNNATYTSLSVNWFPQLVGVANISDAALKGTAADFAAALQHDARLFYVHYVARDCTGLNHCLEVPRKLVPVGGIIKLIQRNYINPGSASGPDPFKIINPIAIVLDGKHRPTS